MHAVAADKMERRRLKRRTYIREMMQHYRAKERRDFVALRAEVGELEQELCRLERSRKPPEVLTALPWREVAKALHADEALSVSEKRLLVNQVDDLAVVIQDLVQWLAREGAQGIPRAPKGSADDSWRSASLAAAPATRELGKAWIIKRLIHNAPAMFDRFDFPPFEPGHAFEDIDVQFTEHGYILVGRSQYEALEGPAALAPTFGAFQSHLCGVLAVNGVQPTPQQTTVEASVTSTLHRMATWRGEGVNLLCGAVAEPAHGILVAQQIVDDELWTDSAKYTQRNRMLWFERTYLPCGRKCVARVLLMVHQSKRSDGELVPLDDEVADWRGDLSTCTSIQAKEARYRRGAIDFAQKSFTASRERMSRGRNASKSSE